MSKEYTINGVSPETKEFETKYGKLVTYYLKFEGSDDVVQLNQKPDTEPPQKGDKLFGDIEPTPYGMKFKKASQFQPQLGGFTEDDRKLLKEIHYLLVKKPNEPKAAETVIDDFDEGEPLDLSGIPF